MSMAETSATSFDNMCNIILEATAQDGVIWEQSPHWQLTLETIYSYQNQTVSQDDDLTVVNASFSDMLDTMGLADSGFDSYSKMLAVWKS